MTVYFVRAVGDESKIKIGVADDLERRLGRLATEIEGGIELLAQCPGDVSTEQALHLLFDADRIESEWFSASPDVLKAVATFAHLACGRKFWGRLKAVENMPVSPLDEDRHIAKTALEKLVASFGPMSLGHSLSEAHRLLSERNPAWSRRRVRAIWNSEAARVDLYEMRDLAALLERTDEAFYRDLAVWICPEIAENDE